MNLGDSVQDASRSEPDEASERGVAAGQTTLAPPPPTRKPLQDIQDIIDKLAAVTQQLRHPRMPGSSR